MPDGGTGPSGANDPNKDMLPGEPTPSGNPTSATSNPGVSGVGGQGMQDAGGRDEGVRGFDAAKAGKGPFGAQTLADRSRSWIAENAPSLFTLAIPGATAMSRAVGYARSAGYDVKDVQTDPDGGGRGDIARDRSKALSNAAAASDAAVRSSVNAAGSDGTPAALNGSASLNRQGYASGNRRRRSLFDSGSGSAYLGGA